VILLVGEAPGRRPGRTLSGLDRRLRSLAWAPRVNLLDRHPGSAGKGARFPIGPARSSARRLLEAVPEASFVLVGARVASAFGIPRFEYDWLEFFELRGRSFAVVPHPSGIVRWWNDPGNRRAAELFADEVARLEVVDSVGGR
jgi:hypothetical protein